MRTFFDRFRAFAIDPISVGVVIVVLVVVGVLIIVLGINEGATPPSQAPGTEATCFTYCMGALEFQCGDDEFIGLCFGIWDCKAELGAHTCR